MKALRYIAAAAVMAAVLAGCSTRVEPYNRQGKQNQGQEQQKPQDKEITPTPNKTWTISYEGRKVVDGAYTDEIRVNNVPAGQKYLVSVINRANYATYGGDLAAFLKNELEYNSDYVYEGSPEVIQFGRLRHGQWYAFVIGLDANKNLTGEYTSIMFNVEEEEASQEYLEWLGNWSVSDGRIEYEIKISQIESNQVYRIDGWEVRKDATDWEQMNQEYLEAFFEPSNDRLYFVSQYITTYDDESLDGASVDELFLGQIDYAGLTEEQGLYIVPDENFDLAYAEADIDDKAYVSPCDIRVAVGNDDFAGKFYCMQYVYQEVQSGQWHVYNNDVIRFYDDYGVMKPLTMTRKSTSQDNKPSGIMKRNGKVSVAEEEKPLRARVYQPRSERKAKGVVRAK